MRVRDIPIEDIIVPERRREDYGDLDGLAANIEQRQLLHPIVVADLGDGTFKLAAGERRLKAFQLLGRDEIPCRIYDELSEDERLLIELEENLFRKDLTPLERSKNLVALAETVAKINETEFRAATAQKSKGRPKQPDSLRSVTDNPIVEVSPNTIKSAKEHVKAVESYPELKDSPQKTAIEAAKKLDEMPSKKREEVRQDVSRLRQIVAKAPIPRPSKNSPTLKLDEFVDDIKRKDGALNYFGYDETKLFNVLDSLRNRRGDLDNFIAEIQDYLDERSVIAS